MSYEDIKDQMNDLSSPRTPQDDEGCEQFSQPADIVNPISQQEPVAWRHSQTGQLYDSEEEVPLADGDEWAEPLYADEIMNDAKDAVQPTHASMPLTDEQILDLDEPFGAFARTVLAADRRIAFARAVLAAAGGKP